jgi:hypothetical protein
MRLKGGRSFELGTRAFVAALSVWLSICGNNPARFAVSSREISITGEATCKSF